MSRDRCEPRRALHARAMSRRMSQEKFGWWRRADSNRRPPACKAGALPAELRPLEPVQGLRQFLARPLQLSCLPVSCRSVSPRVAEPGEIGGKSSTDRHPRGNVGETNHSTGPPHHGKPSSQHTSPMMTMRTFRPRVGATGCRSSDRRRCSHLAPFLTPRPRRSGRRASPRLEQSWRPRQRRMSVAASPGTYTTCSDTL
jgi:hypothetical protein